MIENKNALAELAECIKNADIQIGKMAGCSFECIRKSQRIVAELAKVKWTTLLGVGRRTFPDPAEARDAVENCRAIAEEGTKDGK